MMMRLMTRENKEQAGQEVDQVHVRSSDDSMAASKKRSMGGLHICLSWNVVARLAVVGLGIWGVAPNLVSAAVPVLVVLACPFAMLLTMHGMGRAQCAA